MIPRQYQRDAGNAIYTEFANGTKRTLVEMATGLGKSFVIGMIANHENNSRNKTLIIVHRKELINQLAGAVSSFGIDVDIEQAKEFASHHAPVVVASVASMKGDRLARFNREHFDLVIADEAHHSVCDGWKAIIHSFDARAIGFTATAYRSDKQNLGSVFETLAYRYNLRDGIKDGWLSPITTEQIPIKVDISKARSRGGDLDAGDLDEAIRPYLEQILTDLYQRAPARHVLAFLPLVKTSKMCAEIALKMGWNASHVDGTSADSGQIIQAFKDGHINFLSNADLLTEGADIPITDLILWLKPTKSTGRLVQGLGRGTRLYEGKTDCYFPDYLWLAGNHKIIRPVNLMAEDEEEAQKMLEKSACGKPCDLVELESEARVEIANEREAKIAKYIDENRHKKKKQVDIDEYGYYIGSGDIINYSPTFDWEKQPATDSQKQRLDEIGLDNTSVTRGFAELVISEVSKREGLATPKQIRWLHRQGINPDGMTKDQASERIDKRNRQLQHIRSKR